MPSTLPIAIGAGIITLTGAMGIAIYSTRDAIKDARNNRARDFLDFVDRFRSKILDPGQGPDFWLPYFNQKMPELRRRFDGAASGIPPEKRRQLNEQIVTLVHFFLLPPEEIHERAKEIKTLIEQLNR